MLHSFMLDQKSSDHVIRHCRSPRQGGRMSRVKIKETQAQHTAISDKGCHAHSAAAACYKIFGCFPDQEGNANIMFTEPLAINLTFVST